MESYNVSNLNVKNESLLNEYLAVIKANFKFLLLINGIIFSFAVTYSVLAPDIYESTVNLKISPQKQNIAESNPGRDYVNSEQLDRMLANEVETLGNPGIFKQATQMVVDTLNKLKSNIKATTGNPEQKYGNVSYEEIAEKIDGNISFEQKTGLDFIEIKASSTSPLEASLIANAYANAYRDFNLLENQQKFTILKKYLAEHCVEKRKELNNVEDKIKVYKLKGGVVELSDQTRDLISVLSNIEAQKNTTNIELSRVSENLNQYKNELKRRDPSITNYLDSKSNEPYINKLQDEIARLQTQRDIAQSSSTKNNNIILDYDNKINELKSKLKSNISNYQANVLSASPEEIKDLTSKVFEAETNYKSLLASKNQLNSVLGNYESKFNSIPAKSIELARMERERLTLEKLYMSLEANYQEASVNESSTPGNVLIMNYASVPDKPAKPKRSLIVILGLILGHGLGIGILFLKNALNKTVRTPDDIIDNNANVLAWIPKFGSKKSDAEPRQKQLIFINEPESLPAEAFRTFRTRIQNILDRDKQKIILITSTAPREGKSTVSSNLSASFAKANLKTLLVDCDLRVPSVQSIFNIKGSKGLVEHLSQNASVEECIKKSIIPNLDIMIAGKVPQDPSELLSSPQMEVFLNKMKDSYDVIICDAPPVMAVTDSEVITKFVDMSILVVSANKTEIDWMKESIELLKKGRAQFYGVLLNNFNSKSTYHSYYKYYNKDYKKIKR